jgi:hypothetical protein
MDSDLSNEEGGCHDLTSVDNLAAAIERVARMAPTGALPPKPVCNGQGEG